MHNHDLDLVAALADGSLPPEQVSPVRDTVSTCGECRAEFDAQRLILEVLAEPEPASLSEWERARLHQAIAQLDAPRPKAAWLMWAPRLAVAAVAVAFVGAFGMVLLNGANDGDGAADSPVAAEEPAETTAASSAGGLTLQAESASDAGAEETTAADQATEAAAAAPATLPWADLDQLDQIEDLADATYFARQARSMIEVAELDCYEFGARLNGLVGVATFRYQGADVEFYSAEEESMAYERPTCEVVELP